MNDAPILSVIIATKNRAEAIERYALASLQKTPFRDFVCVVWDASDDGSTETVVKGGAYTFPLEYFRAPRLGSASQRNDAIDYVLKNKPSVRYVLFIDDDSELLEEAIEGVMDTFEDESVWGVNIPHFRTRNEKNYFYGCGVVTSSLNTLPIRQSLPFGLQAQWLYGCSMAYRKEVFSDLHLRFPEALERFGGYAVAEDVVFSHYLTKNFGKLLLNSKRGSLCHHEAEGNRLNRRNKEAAYWYNFHLFFYLIYAHDSKLKYLPQMLMLKFRLLNRIVSVLPKTLFKQRISPFPLFQGMFEARRALKEFLKALGEQDISSIVRKEGEKA